MKKKKTPNIGVIMMPNVTILPKSVAASIGKTINRFAQMEIRQQFILKRLLRISIKQARIVLRISRPRMFIQSVKLLLQFHKININVAWKSLNSVLEEADAARNALAHSVFMRQHGSKLLHIQLTSRSWELGDDYESLSRSLVPEGRLVNRKFLVEQRKHVEEAFTMIRDLEAKVHTALEALNEKRRTIPALERRSHRN